ncbi:glutathione synthetase isoform X2 [Brachionus plicatilis]|uniref:Glutathione synthetase n=1 Tax=Brachionus plicatilis TaxID=10195 RepID=A0A3M7SCT6_BRAPC|nr:glutathione synthetase isoform X2 [Brachionus plicatilis]
MSQRIGKKILLDENNLEEYIISARDALFRTGVPYFTSNSKENKKFCQCSFLPLTLIPSPFPRNEFDLAIKLQLEWNNLMIKFSSNTKLIYDALKDVIKIDQFIRKHWEICQKVNQQNKKQSITLNIMRIDYMIDYDKMEKNAQTALSQIEINTFACGGCGIPERIKEFHKYMLHRTGNYDTIEMMDSTNLLDNIVESLIKSLELYMSPNAHFLLVIRNLDYTLSDHRLIEYALFEKAPKIKLFRMTFTEINQNAVLDDHGRLFIQGCEIGIVYFKSGFDPSDYPSEKEWEARYLLEQSMAIKSPKIEFQLMNTKKFQQYLYESNALEMYIDNEKTLKLIRSTFVKQLTFKKGFNQAIFDLIEKECENLVLKNQREGGGNNIFGKEIKLHIQNFEEKELEQFVLMEKINSTKEINYLIYPPDEIKKAEISNEIGTFGIALG